MPLLAVKIDPVTRQDLREGIEAAHPYQRFGDAVKHVIRSIHAIPSLFPPRFFWRTTLGEVEVYLGRAGATEDHVANRFKSSFGRRGHEFGMVVLRAATSLVVSWEGSANRILRGLDRRGLICVANVLAGENGPTPSTPTSVVYLTWRLVPRVRVGKPSPSDVDGIAKEVADSNYEDRPAKQIATAMKPITRPDAEVASVLWHPNHTT